MLVCPESRGLRARGVHKLFADQDAANQIGHAEPMKAARIFSPEIIEERATLRALTRKWFRTAKRNSGKSAAAIYSEFLGLENIDALGDAGKKMATRLAAGQAWFRPADLEAFMQKCLQAGWVKNHEPGLLGTGIVCKIRRSDQISISETVQRRAAVRADFEAKRAALLAALDEYAGAIERADSLTMPVIDGDDYDAHAGDVRKYAERVRSHHLHSV